jgi:hypothetical protein
VAGPQQRRQEEKRAEKLADIRRQVKDGSLVIRQMTPTERKQHPKPTGERKRGSKRRS